MHLRLRIPESVPETFRQSIAKPLRGVKRVDSRVLPNDSIQQQTVSKGTMPFDQHVRALLQEGPAARSMPFLPKWQWVLRLQTVAVHSMLPRMHAPYHGTLMMTARFRRFFVLAEPANGIVEHGS